MRSLLVLSAIALLAAAATAAEGEATRSSRAEGSSNSEKEKRTAAGRGAALVTPGVKYASPNSAGPQLPAQHYAQQLQREAATQQHQQYLQQLQQQQQPQREQYIQAQPAAVSGGQQGFYLTQSYQPQYNLHYSAQQQQLQAAAAQQQQLQVQPQTQQRYQYVPRAHAAPSPAAAAQQQVQYVPAQQVQYVQQPQHVQYVQPQHPQYLTAAPAAPQAYTTGYLIPGPNGQTIIMVPVGSTPGGAIGDPQAAGQQQLVYYQPSAASGPGPAYILPQQYQAAEPAPAPAAVTYVQPSQQQAAAYYQQLQQQQGQSQPATSHQTLRHADRATAQVTRAPPVQQQQYKAQ